MRWSLHALKTRFAAIVSPVLGAGDGVQDCSSLLPVTVTPTASTVTETLTVVPTEYNTGVDTAIFTETVTTTASTETQVVTVGTTVTAATHTDVVTVTTTVVATQTNLQTVATTLTGVATRILPVKARGDTVTAIDLAPKPTIPSYAAADCPSWEKYVSACECASVVPNTVTAQAPPATTITVSVTAGAVIVAVPSTVSTTETVFVSVTATTGATEVDTVFVTATTAVTESAAVSTTVTVTQTVTQTIAPSASCKPYNEVGAFKAIATEVNGSPLLIYANLLNGLTGGVNWQQASTSTSAAVQNKFIWALDSNGYLGLAYNVPPYSYKYAVYMSTGTPGSNWPQIGTQASVDSSVNNGAPVTKIKGCVNSVTGELTLEAAGRTNILYCGVQLWMSAGAGEDVNRGAPCVKMFPKIVPV
jgi:hypothetical protein